MKTALASLLFAVAALAQDGNPVSLSQGPPLIPYQGVYNYTGTNLVSQCFAASYSPLSGDARVVTPAPGLKRSQVAVSISAATNANPVVFTSTGHGFNVNSRPIVVIVGGTGNWAAVNGTFTATVVSANTFSIPVDSTTFGAVTGTLIFRTTAPRSVMYEWAVQVFAYDGSNNLLSKTWLNGSSSLSARCSDAGSTTTNIQ